MNVQVVSNIEPKLFESPSDHRIVPTVDGIVTALTSSLESLGFIADDPVIKIHAAMIMSQTTASPGVERAEIRLAKHYIQQSYDQRRYKQAGSEEIVNPNIIIAPPLGYLGVSKPSCLFGHLWLQCLHDLNAAAKDLALGSSNQPSPTPLVPIFFTLGIHQKPYPKWAFTDLPIGAPSIRDQFTTYLLRIYARFLLTTKVGQCGKYTSTPARDSGYEVPIDTPGSPADDYLAEMRLRGRMEELRLFMPTSSGGEPSGHMAPGSSQNESGH